MKSYQKRSSKTKRIRPETLLRTIQEVSTVLTSELSYDTALKKCLQVTIDVLGYDFGAVMAWGPKGVTMNATYKLHPDYLPKLFTKGFHIMGNSPSEIALSTGKYYVMEDVFNDYRFRWGRMLGREAGYRSLIYVPLVIRNKVLGTIVSYTKNVHFFPQREIRFLGAVAEQAAVMLENTRLYWGLEEKVRERTVELQTEKDKVSAIINSLTDGVIMVDSQDKIIFLNPQAEEMLGVQEKTVFGKKITREIIKEASDKNEKLKFQNLLNLLSLKGEKKELAIKEPTESTFEVTTLPVLTPQKKELGIMKILHDVTREKEIERMKGEFISIAAHQLRTPLSAIKWALKIIIDKEAGELTREQDNLLGKVYQSNERMIELVKDLLDVSRIEEGKFGFKFTEVQLERIFEKSISSFSGLIKKRGVRLSYHTFPKPLPKIKADAEKLSMAIENLISNAVNYTFQGEINIKISYNPAKQNISAVIKDTGMGIPESEQYRVFDKFFRGSNVMKLAVGGTGLGLFIARNIIKAHKGELKFKSRENKGSVFYFTLPVRK